MIGRTLGNYRIVEQIGMGGMATVYKAYDPDTDRYVAIKILPEHFSQDPKFRQRFEREAKAIANLEHIHILPLFSYGEEEGTAYMVMRYLKAGSLTERIRSGALPLPEASRLLSQIASALDHAHAHGVLHRDVKPSNVLLDAESNAYLTDFGIAKMVESTLDLTGGGLLGTPAYMSPEQCRGNETLTPASDQYSLGIILYEMVTGRAPFQAETPIALIHMQLNDPLPIPRQIRPDLPEEAERVILKALTKDPELRFPTCGAMATAFARAVAEFPTEQPVAGDLTVGDEAPVTPTAAVVEEATVLHGTAEPAVAAAKPRRRMRGWVLGLIGVLLILALLAAAIVAGLALFGGAEETTVGVRVSEVDEAGISEAEEVVEETPEEHTAVPVAVDETPMGIKEVRPCDWEGFGPGLCIYTLPREQPSQRILTDSNLEIVGSVSWSPDGQQITFAAVDPDDRREENITIYIVNADGTNLTELPKIGNDINPAWSPDGEWLIFHSSCNLALMRPDGSDPTLIWQGHGDWCVQWPQWAPDSDALVVSVTEGDGGWEFPMVQEIWVVSDEGETLTPIATMAHQDEGCVSFEVAFSLDGKQVAYIDNECQAWLANADGSGEPELLADFPYGWLAMTHPQWGKTKPIAGEEPPAAKIVEVCDETVSQLCIRDAETDRVTQIATELDFEEIYGVTWSPDGKQIVFDGGLDPGREGHDLYIVNADGSDLRPVTHNTDRNDIGPSWSPDGEWIAFHRDCELWLIRPDGSDEVMVLPWSEEFCTGSITWSPDSQRLTFVNFPGNAEFANEVWVTDLTGAEARPIFIAEPPLDLWVVAWSPDGKKIAVWYGEAGEEKFMLLNPDGSGEPKHFTEPQLDKMEPWTWLPDFWPPWGDKIMLPVVSPGESEESRPAPEDPWGHVVIPPDDTVIVAFVGALSGNIPELGELQHNAFLMALDEHPDIKGFGIDAVILDGGCMDEMLGREVANGLAAAPGVVGVIGPSCSPSCSAGAPIYEAAHLVQISPSCTRPELTEQGLKTFNRVVIRDDRGGEALNTRIVDMATYQEFAENYQGYYDQSLLASELGPYAAYTYDATKVLLKAIEASAVVDEGGNLVIGRQALADAVRRTPRYPGVTGVIGFDEHGDRLLPDAR